MSCGDGHNNADIRGFVYQALTSKDRWLSPIQKTHYIRVLLSLESQTCLHCEFIYKYISRPIFAFCFGSPIANSWPLVYAMSHLFGILYLISCNSRPKVV